MSIATLMMMASTTEADEDPFAGMRKEMEAEGARSDDSNSGLVVPEDTGRPDGYSWETITALEVLGNLEFANRQADVAFDGGLGIEILRRINGPEGLWGTAELQLRLRWDTRDDIPRLEGHNVYLEKRFLFGRLNLMAGHFQVPFGLETLPIDTHTTLIQLSNPLHLGMKHDWGLGIRGQLRQVDYALAYTIGSGMDVQLRTAGMLTGRIGWNASGDVFGVGLSANVGERFVRRHAGTRRSPVFGWRAGTDITAQAGPVGWMAEAAVGQDDGDLVASCLARLEGETADRWFSLALQYRFLQTREMAQRIRKHLGELQMSVRLAFVNPDSFLRFHWTAGRSGDRWVLDGILQVYLRFGV